MESSPWKPLPSEESDLQNAIPGLLATPGSRLMARLADVLLLAAPLSLLTFTPKAQGQLLWVLLAAPGILECVVVVGQLYSIVRSAQSLGKQAFGIQVVDRKGVPIGALRYLLLREGVPMMISLLPFVGRFFSLIDNLAIYTLDRRTLHDRLADTYVIDINHRFRKNPS